MLIDFMAYLSLIQMTNQRRLQKERTKINSRCILRTVAISPVYVADTVFRKKTVHFAGYAN